MVSPSHAKCVAACTPRPANRTLGSTEKDHSAKDSLVEVSQDMTPNAMVPQQPCITLSNLSKTLGDYCNSARFRYVVEARGCTDYHRRGREGMKVVWATTIIGVSVGPTTHIKQAELQ